MAEAGKKTDKADGHGLMLVVIALLILLLGAVGVLGYYLFTNPYGAAAGQLSKQGELNSEAKGYSPIFQKMDTFVVNLAGNGGALLQVDMQAQLRDENAKKAFTDLMPKVRSAVILLLSSKTADELSTSDGKLQLRSQVERVVNDALGGGGVDPVQSILFTSFIIQSQ